MNTKYLIEEQTLTDIANSIREMEGSDDTILVEEYADRVKSIDPNMLEYAYILEYAYWHPMSLDALDFDVLELSLCEKLIKEYLEREVL